MSRSESLRLFIGLIVACPCTLQAEQPNLADNTETRKKEHAAVSPNGYSIELVAIVRMDQKERSAWKPDGSKIEISEKWGRLTEARNQNPTHGFVFRCQGFQKGQNLGWRTVTPRTASPILKDQVPEFISTSVVLKDGSPITMRIGVLGQWGPWQRVDASGTPDVSKPVPKEHKALYDSVKSVKVHYGKAGPLRTGFILEGFVGNKQIEDCGEYEVMAVDGEGKRNDRRGVGIWNGGQIPYFDVTEDETAHFEYRMRPYLDWMTFENIPLEPGKDSKLKITVEKVDPKENAKAN